MAQQLAYVIITPYSLHKSRTGGLLSRLITRTGMELAGARMFAHSAELVSKYAEATLSANDPQDRRYKELIYRYIQQNLAYGQTTGRPGNRIDFFSRAGLFIVGVKVHRMSGAQAIEFYGPVRETLRIKLKDVVAAKAKAAIEKELGLKIGTEQEQKFGEILGPTFGDNQFDNIVRFMAGHAPAECAPEELSKPGSEKGIALVYEGVEAVRKIRDILGPTDPSKAPPGSIRREFGQNIMINAAHASDSEENARREMGIINVSENNFRQVVE